MWIPRMRLEVWKTIRYQSQYTDNGSERLLKRDSTLEIINRAENV